MKEEILEICRKWEDNIKVDPKEIFGMEWIGFS
jgi:hypothetical protein